ncbi:MAG: DoxX family protein, partial [Candidatus Eremiobacteraeota bacterium]|nr:DoxX family protein [Candidatus Eremiobacteraeota bacterium]
PYYVLPMGVQVIAGVLLLVNRFVPLALVATAAVLANALTFHLTMMPEGLPVALIATGLWFVVAFRYRANLAPLLAASHTKRGRFS